MKDKKIFFPNLDGLRFIAFLMVILGHTLKTPIKRLNIGNAWIEEAFYFFMSGSTGVSIFFVLSGFLITYLILAEIALNGKLDVIKFYIRRSLRIWPLYFLILLLVFVGMPLMMKLLGSEWGQYDMRPWFYFLFISNFDVMHISLTNGRGLLPSSVTWSVAIEEQFYLVWPLLFAFIPVKFYKYIFPLILMASYIFRSFYAGNTSFLYYHTLSVCGDLALGGWVAYMSFTKKEFVLLFENQSDKLRVVIYIMSIIFLYFLRMVENNFTDIFGRLIQTIFFSYIILDQNFCKQKSFKFSNNRFMSFWGKYTFGLYLWHAIVLWGIKIVLTRAFHLSFQHTSTLLISAITGFAGTFIISYASYQFFELYFLNLKKKFAVIGKN